MRCLKCLKCLNVVHFFFRNIVYFKHEKDPKNKVRTGVKVKTIKALLQSSYNEVLGLSYRPGEKSNMAVYGV